MVLLLKVQCSKRFDKSWQKRSHTHRSRHLVQYFWFISGREKPMKCHFLINPAFSKHTNDQSKSEFLELSLFLMFTQPTRITFIPIHPQSLTARPWKKLVGRRSFPFGMVPCQGRAVELRRSQILTDNLLLVYRWWFLAGYVLPKKTNTLKSIICVRNVFGTVSKHRKKQILVWV